MISVAFLTDWVQITSLRERWDYLYSLTDEGSFTHSFDWYRTVCAAREDKPVVAVAIVAGKVIGLWPMFLSESRSHFRQLQTLTSGGLEAPLLGPIGPHPTATAALVARHLGSSEIWTDALLIAANRANFDVARYSSAFRSAGLAISEEPAQPVGVIHLKGRWTDLLSQSSESVRLAVYRQRHRSQNDGLTFDRFRPAAGAFLPDGLLDRRLLDQALNLCVSTRLERQTLRSTIEIAIENGAADIAILRDDARLVAAAFSFVTASRLENIAIGMERRLGDGIGIRFMDEFLRDSQLRGDARMTFIVGPDHLANAWGTERRRRVAIRFQVPGLPRLGLHRTGARLLRSFRRSRPASPELMT